MILKVSNKVRIIGNINWSQNPMSGFKPSLGMKTLNVHLTLEHVFITFIYLIRPE